MINTDTAQNLLQNPKAAVTSLPPSILHSALHQLLVNWLQKSNRDFQLGLSAPVEASAGNQSNQDLPSLVFLHSKDIPLNRIKFDHQVSDDSGAAGQSLHYVSALAFKVAQVHHQPSAVLAEAISINFQQLQTSTETPDQLLQKFTVSLAEPGWLHFRLSESGIAEWLQQLLETTHHSLPVDLPRVTEIDRHAASVWPLLLAHSRCGVLLRQANQMGLDLSSPGWLDATGALRCRHSAEWQLIGQICDTLDDLVKPQMTIQQTFKLAVGFSEAFQTFDARCRIWGELRSDPLLAEVRLSLVQISQYLLRLLLEQKLGLTAPLEL